MLSCLKKKELILNLPSTVFCVNVEDLFGLDVVFGICVSRALKKLYNCNRTTVTYLLS